MKNLKKALALVVASVSVFGTIASANNSFVNKLTTNFTLQTQNGNHTECAYVGASGHTLTKEADGSVTFASKPVTSGMGDFTVYGINRKSYGYGVGEHTFKKGIMGKVEGVLEFSYTETSNTSISSDLKGGSGDAGNINLFGINYTEKDGTTAVASAGVAVKWYNSVDNGTFTANLDGGDGVKQVKNMQHKMRLTVVFDPATGVYTSNIVDTEQNNKVMATWTNSLPEGAVFNYIHPGTHIRIRGNHNARIYSYSISCETVATKDTAVSESNGTLTATVKARNNDDGVATNGRTTKNAVAILAQYDANGRILDCTVGDKKALKSASPNSDSSVGHFGSAGEGQYETLTASASKANGYSYSKVFVWDGADMMNPFAEVYSTKAD